MRLDLARKFIDLLSSGIEFCGRSSWLLCFARAAENEPQCERDEGEAGNAAYDTAFDGAGVA